MALSKTSSQIAGILVLLLVIVTGCGKNEFKVSVDAESDRTLVLKYYASDPAKGWVMDMVIPLHAGKGELKCPTVNPALVWVYTTPGPYPQILLYAKRGETLKISGNGPDPVKWSVKGNPISEELSEWRINNASLIEAAIRSASAPDGKEGVSKLNKAVAAYVSSHKSSPAALFILLAYYDRNADETGFRKAWDTLDKDVKTDEWLSLVSRSDLAFGLGGADELPSEFVLNTVATGCDTITRGKPTLLFFTRTRMETYRQSISRLREFASHAGDSASRVIAEISMEPDSAARWQPLRMDSLRNVVRGWMPLGISDPEARKLGVRNIPYVIVANRRGEVIYRGEDFEKAMAIMKETL